jgi:CHAT domain-containing protein
MAYFYESWRKQGMSPPEALRQAQIWMRDTTNGEKQEYFQMKKAKVEEDVMDYEEQRYYEHPFHWAGFGYMGV